MGLEKALVCACVSRSHASMILKRFTIRCSEEAENIKFTIINVIHIFMVAIRWSLNHFPTFAYSQFHYRPPIPNSLCICVPLW